MIDDLSRFWQTEMKIAACPNCDAAFVTAAKQQRTVHCPHCVQALLEWVEDEDEVAHFPYRFPPEQVAPFTFLREDVALKLLLFSKSVPYAPADLTFANLQDRLQPIYFPSWLVDVHIKAQWHGEAGFHYEAVTHEDQYDETRGWLSKTLREQRTRWEPYVGQLDRSYANIPAHAIEETHLFTKLPGQKKPVIQPYEPTFLTNAFIHLPVRLPNEAWPEIEKAAHAIAAHECQAAAAADDFRLFSWESDFGKPNWSQQLSPIYVTWYVDDNGKRHPLYIHGQSGASHGEKQLSWKKVWQRAGWFIVAALGLLLLSGLFNLIEAVPHIYISRLQIIAVILMVCSLIPVTQAATFEGNK